MNEGWHKILASNIDRDGLGLELWNDEEEVAEVFRSDKLQTLTVSVWQENVPLELIEDLIVEAKQRLLPFHDDQVSEGSRK